MVLCMDTDITLPRHLRMRLSNTNHSISCATFAPVTPLRLYHKNINGNTSHCEAHGICTSKQKLFRSATKAKLRNTVSSLLEDSLVQDAILSIDVGTSGTKAALCFLNRSGHGPVARAKYETSSPGHLQMTQCVDDWSRAAITTSRNVLSSNPDVSIAAIAVTGTLFAWMLFHCSGRMEGLFDDETELTKCFCFTRIYACPHRSNARFDCSW